MKLQKVRRLNTSGLSAAGLWVRRQLPVPCLTDEALCLAEVQHTWDLHGLLTFDRVTSAYAEVSSPELPPTWVYLLELVGRRLPSRALVANHPLSGINEGEEVRLLALLQPPELMMPGVLVETAAGHRRMLWLQPVGHV